MFAEVVSMQAEAIDCRIVKAGQGDGRGDVRGGYSTQQRAQRAGLIATDFRDVMKDDFAGGGRIEEPHVKEAIVHRPYGRKKILVDNPARLFGY